MTAELGIALLVLLGMVIYVVAKVRMYMKESEAQWSQVDKSKLREWDDED